MKIKHTATRLAVALSAGAMLLAACVTPGNDTSTTNPPAPDSTVTTTSTPVTVQATGSFDTATCGELEGHLLCEAYELIQRHYVDPVSDDSLVTGALAGLAEIDVAPGSGIDVCPLPAEAFVDVCNEIDAEQLDATAAEEAAVMGMIIEALDPNSAYFDATTLAMIEEEQSGEIEGIGALVSTMEAGSDPNECQVISDTCRIEIVSTIEGGPARAAELQPGDIFVTVDGQDIEGWTVDEVTAAVRGPAGTEVDLTFERSGETFTVTIERAAIQVPVVSSEMVGNVAYLRLNLFTQNADEQVAAELANLLENDPSALVLDLRDNPGGLLSTAVAVTSEFISEGLVVSTESPGASTPYNVTPGGLATDFSLPMYVVVNQGSASASEVVAGALSDTGRATIVGENTYGKNTVQQRFPLSNGGALKLTIARWLTPDGHDFGGDGITPDVSANLGAELSVPDVVAAVVGVTTAG